MCRGGEGEREASRVGCESGQYRPHDVLIQSMCENMSERRVRPRTGVSPAFMHGLSVLPEDLQRVVWRIANARMVAANAIMRAWVRFKQRGFEIVRFVPSEQSRDFIGPFNRQMVASFNVDPD